MNEVNNNQIKEQTRVTKKSIGILIVIITIVLLLSGTTFAYFWSELSNNTTIGGDAGSVNLTLNVTKVLPNKTGVDDIIIINFNELADSINSSCMDNDGTFALCQIYKVTLSNSINSANADVKGMLSFNNETAPNLSWISLGNNYSSTTNYTSEMLGNTFNTASSEFNNFIDSYLLKAGDTVNFYIVVWVNESEEEQYDNGTYSGTVRFEDSNGKGVTATFNS